MRFSEKLDWLARSAPVRSGTLLVLAVLMWQRMPAFSMAALAWAVLELVNLAHFRLRRRGAPS